MNIKEELGFIQMWFDDIKEMASTKRNGNGILISDSRMLAEIAVKSKDASEYVEMLLKDKSL